MQEFQAKVIAVSELSENISEVELEPVQPAKLEFSAGQYISVHIGDVGDRPDYRSYSIASPAFEQNKFTLCIKADPQSSSGLFWKQLKIGDIINHTGPSGYFVLEEDDPNRHWIFAASGTGIAPIHSMIMDLFHQGTWRRIDLYFGVRWEKNLIFREDFEQLAKEHNNFNFFPSITRESDTWKGHHGRITKHLEEDLITGEGVSAYICGSSEMVADIQELLITQGVDDYYIYTEDFSTPLSNKH